MHSDYIVSLITKNVRVVIELVTAVIKATNTVWTKCHVRAVIKPVKAVQTEGPAQRTYVCPFILRSQFASCDDDEVSSSNS